MALIVLRIREPELPRPFRVPGGMFGAVAVGVAPMLLLGFSVVRSQSEQVLGMSALAFGMLLIAAGVVAYFVNVTLKPSGWAAAEKPERSLKIRHGSTRIFTDLSVRIRADPWLLSFGVK